MSHGEMRADKLGQIPILKQDWWMPRAIRLLRLADKIGDAAVEAASYIPEHLRGQRGPWDDDVRYVIDQLTTAAQRLENNFKPPPAYTSKEWEPGREWYQNDR